MNIARTLLAASIMVALTLAPATGSAARAVGKVVGIRVFPNQQAHIQIEVPMPPGDECPSSFFNANPNADGTGTDRLISIATAALLSRREVEVDWFWGGTGNYCTINWIRIF